MLDHVSEAPNNLEQLSMVSDGTKKRLLKTLGVTHAPAHAHAHILGPHSMIVGGGLGVNLVEFPSHSALICLAGRSSCLPAAATPPRPCAARAETSSLMASAPDSAVALWMKRQPGPKLRISSITGFVSKLSPSRTPQTNQGEGKLPGLGGPSTSANSTSENTDSSPKYRVAPGGGIFDTALTGKVHMRPILSTAPGFCLTTQHLWGGGSLTPPPPPLK